MRYSGYEKPEGPRYACGCFYSRESVNELGICNHHSAIRVTLGGAK